MRNIHLIPTPNPSRLYKFEDKLIKNDLIGLYEYKEKGYIGQNICITSDAEIKEGDWCLPFMNGKLDITEEYPIYKMKNGDFYCEDKKIILTTDTELIKDGVQPINDDFLEWFVKNPSCQYAIVDKEKDEYKIFIPSVNIEDKIIIPKEEPKQENCCTPIGQIKRYINCKGCDRKPKQETLEEAAELYKKLHEFRVKKEQLQRKEAFIDGAKCQQEQNKNKYSEKDIEEYAEYCTTHVLTTQIGNPYLSIRDWFKQFKKK